MQQGKVTCHSFDPVLESMNNREYLAYGAKVAAEIEAYEDMDIVMHSLASLDIEFNVGERRLLSVTYESLINDRKIALEKLVDMENGDTEDGVNKGGILQDFRGKIQQEIIDISRDGVNLLQKHLIPSAKTGDSKAFFHMMQGDFFRNQAKAMTVPEKKNAIASALAAYVSASDIAMSTPLAPTDPVRLQIALKLSEFYYDVLELPDRAIQLAKAAIDDATDEFNTDNEENNKESREILQRLAENVKQWESDMTTGDNKD